jgi:cytochrome b6-f complex iron-sulfur subunit
MAEKTVEEAISADRRGFLNRLIGLSAVAWLGSVVYPVVRYLKPLPGAGPSGPVPLSPEQLGKLAAESFVIVPAGARRAMVFRDKDGRVRALDARCTHEGCTVQFLPSESTIWCACHNARFAMDGQVLSGPPPRPLPVFAAEEKDGAVLVSLRTPSA